MKFMIIKYNTLTKHLQTVEHFIKTRYAYQNVQLRLDWDIKRLEV